MGTKKSDNDIQNKKMNGLPNQKTNKAVVIICIIIVLAVAFYIWFVNVVLPEDESGISFSTELCGEEYHYYSKQYLKALDEIDEEDYDKNFIDIYDNGKYIINGNEYGIHEIYLERSEDNSTHLTKAGENDTDIITGKDFYLKRKNIVCFRDSSAFYEMYINGWINSKDIIINQKCFDQYIKNWDGSYHFQTPELEAERRAHEAYVKRYGE